MGFIIGLLTAVLVLDCVALAFLILIQLPKKEAGLGLAFGGSAADALFGAGSGTVLTKATKYAAVLFFALSVVLGVMQSNYHRKSKDVLKQMVEKQTQAGGLPMPPTAPATTTPTPAAPATQPPQTAPASPAPNQPAPANPAPATPAPQK
jgi:preprotein translocase subunit SecG